MPSAVFGAPPHAGSLSIIPAVTDGPRSGGRCPAQIPSAGLRGAASTCRRAKTPARVWSSSIPRRRIAIVRRRLDAIVRRQLRAGELLESRGARRPLIHDARDASGERVFECLVWRDEDGCEDGAVLEHGDAVRRQLVRHQDAANPRGRRRRSCGIDVEDLNRFAPAVVRRVERVVACLAGAG